MDVSPCYIFVKKHGQVPSLSLEVNGSSGRGESETQALIPPFTVGLGQGFLDTQAAQVWLFLYVSVTFPRELCQTHRPLRFCCFDQMNLRKRRKSHFCTDRPGVFTKTLVSMSLQCRGPPVVAGPERRRFRREKPSVTVETGRGFFFGDWRWSLLQHLMFKFGGQFLFCWMKARQTQDLHNLQSLK